MTKRILLSLGLAATLLLGACGGDDDDDDDSGDTTATTAAGQSATSEGTGTTGEATKPADATKEPTTDSGGSGASIPDDLKEVLGDFASAEFTATYELKTSAGDGTNTVVQKGDKYAATMALGGTDVTIIVDGDVSYTCFNVAGAGTCTKGDGGVAGEGDVPDLRDFTALAEEASAEYKSIDDREVNGFDSKCWEVTDSASNTAVVMCIAEDEKTVSLVESEGFTMELKEYSKDVDDSAFEPPYPVQ